MTVTQALVYTRVSSDEQAREGLSLPAQLAECRRYAVQHGWILGGEYQDVLTGTRDDRPQYQQLLADVRQLRAQSVSVVIVVAALDRFGRRLLERIRSRDELRALGVAVHSVREGGEVSDLVANILGSVAQEEVRRLGERVRATRAYLLARGWQPPGRVPWGYRLREPTQAERDLGAPARVLDLEHLEAAYVRELYARVAGGESGRSAARWVAALPAVARGGRLMPRQSVLATLRSPTYLAAEPARWPQLIDDVTWARVQAFLADHRLHAHQATGRYLLTGYLACPRCGGNVYGTTSHGRTYYRCSAEQADGRTGCSAWSARPPNLDRIVLAEVAALLAPFARANRAQLRRLLRVEQQPDELASYRDSRLAKFRRDAEDARAALTKAALMLVNEQIDRAGYDLVRTDQQAQLDAAEAEITRLGEVPPSRAQVDVDALVAMLPRWGEILEQASIPDQRAVLAELVTCVAPTRVGYGRYRVEITWTEDGEMLRRMGTLVALR